MVESIQIYGITGLPIIKPGDDIAKLIVDRANELKIGIKDRDIIVITHVVVARSEGKLVNLNEIEPSEFSKVVASIIGKDPRHVEVILRNSKSIVRMRNGLLICKTKHGIVCANAGVDLSNSYTGDYAILLPDDPDLSAKRIRKRIEELSGAKVAVIISDTQGRPFRKGVINVAIGCSGIQPLWDRRGELDLFGRPLRSKITCVADEICSAAELVMGQAAEAIPVAIIRGYKYKEGDEPALEILRDEKEDIFL